jgi:hypothetical protein
MATLNTFGFTPRKGRSSSHNLSSKVIDNSQSVAFIQPFDIKPTLSSSCNINNNNNNNIQTRKFSKKANKKNSNKITHYFNTMTTTAMDIDMEEREPCCIIRKKLPFINLLTEIEEEHTQEIYLIEEAEYNHKPCKKRFNGEESVPLFKRQKAIDTDLSNVMNKYLNIKSRIMLNSTNINSTIKECIKEYKQDKEEEDLKRTIRCKLSVEESNLFILQMTREYLS